MQTIWVGIDPRTKYTRILAIEGSERTLLKAHLLPLPSTRLALPALLEAIALWQGAPVRAALVVEGSDSSSRERFAHEAFGTMQSLLYSVEFVADLRRPRRRDDISGMPGFGDLRQLLLFEAMR